MIARRLPAAAVVAAAIASVTAMPVDVPVTLSATSLVMSGTGNSLSIPENTPEYIRSAVMGTDRQFVGPSGLCVGGDPGCTLVAVYTPEQLRPVTGWNDMTLDESVAVGQANLDRCIRRVACTVTMPPYTVTGQQQLTDTSDVVFGLSQSALIATYEKADLIAHPPDKTVSFILVANPARPNGGIAERFVGLHIPFVGITFNGATQTNSPQPTPLLTEDVARQYDGWADFPTNPVNLLALVNALAGTVFFHPYYSGIDAPQLLQGMYQDTTYYLEPAPIVPLLVPLSRIPVVGMPLALMLDPPLRVLVEAGYNRTINPGQPTPVQWHYATNVITAAVNLVRAVPTGWDDAIAAATDDPANRPFHTEPQGVYGVGGPPVYAGAIDPYGPLPVQPVAAQADPAPAAALSQEKAPELASMAEHPAPRLPRPDRATHRRAAAPPRPHPAAADDARDYSPRSSKIATARVHPADAA